jgi:hypothetical protein
MRRTLLLSVKPTATLRIIQSGVDQKIKTAGT